MDSDSNFSPLTGGHEPDFGFAFNNHKFSDRVLVIKILADSTSHKTKHDLFHSFATLDVSNCHQPINVEDEEGDMNLGEDEVPVIEDSPSGDEASNSENSIWSEHVLSMKTLHISSSILAEKSPFFFKLFSNGMMESEQKHVTLKINSSEEVAFMELLNFMYTSKLSTNTCPAILDVLMVADKFEVASCMRHCAYLLSNLPMSKESALMYMNFPYHGVLMADTVQQLTDAASRFLAAHCKDILKYEDELMNFPHDSIQTLLSRDDLQVASEDAVYDFAVKWARTHYQDQDERRVILSSHLAPHIRFLHMTCRKLRKILTCNDLDHEFATKSVLDALFFKAESPHRQRRLATEDPTKTNWFKERAYMYKPIKVVELELPRQQCVLVYLDLKREECLNLYPSGRVHSQAFHVGGQRFFLSAHCDMDPQGMFLSFGFYIGMQKSPVTSTVDYEFSARLNPTEDYILQYRGSYVFSGGKAIGYKNLFNVPWNSFIAEDSKYFINGTLHLKAELVLKS